VFTHYEAQSNYLCSTFCKKQGGKGAGGRSGICDREDVDKEGWKEGESLGRGEIGGRNSPGNARGKWMDRGTHGVVSRDPSMKTF